MAETKYRPGQNCGKTAKYSLYDEKGKLLNEDIDVEKGKRFPPSQQKNCFYKSK